jgi:carbamoyltransferase
MLIVGLNHGEINASAAVFHQGGIRAGAPEERFNRQKLTRLFPAAALQYSLAHVGAELKDAECVAQAWNPGALWRKYNPMISTHRTRKEDYFYSVPDHLLNIVSREPGDWVSMQFSSSSAVPPVYFLNHHLTHAANAFFLSPFEEAAILTADWRGEFECLNAGVGQGTDIHIHQRQSVPHSLGMFYATFTELLGYHPDSDEWKVMALSAFDVDCRDMYKKVRSTVNLADDGTLQLDQAFYKGALIDQPYLYSDRLVQLLGGQTGSRGDEVDDWSTAVAKAMQMVSEEIASHFLCHLFEKTGQSRVVLGGGFFMNSVYNGKVLEQTPFREVYISYAPSDGGNSVGAALYAAHCIHGQKRTDPQNSSFIGPEFSKEEIVGALRRRMLSYKELDTPEEAIAGLIADGEIVAHFDGRMEFGERALGNRSILADPREPKVKERINRIIKYREGYRPFAPAVCADWAHIYFDVAEGFQCRYMEKVVPVRNEFRSKLPAVTHVDGSGRLQTVKEHENPRFFRILRKLGERTGYPIALNTSFNINGEPIVCTPDDALNTFFNSGLQHLVMGDVLVQKD